MLHALQTVAGLSAHAPTRQHEGQGLVATSILLRPSSKADQQEDRRTAWAVLHMTVGLAVPHCSASAQGRPIFSCKPTGIPAREAGINHKSFLRFEASAFAED
ncbi:hypothetical protein ABBQ32_002586 [Trebouxia sp. C0010 RCD-2024]